MTATETLVDALAHYNIPILRNSGNKIEVVKGYAIEVEASGVYKLMQHGDVIAPFDDLDDLSVFILRD